VEGRAVVAQAAEPATISASGTTIQPRRQFAGAAAVKDEDIFIVGAGNSAGQVAI
jgi:hypothetical protein